MQANKQEVSSRADATPHSVTHPRHITHMIHKIHKQHLVRDKNNRDVQDDDASLIDALNPRTTGNNILDRDIT